METARTCTNRFPAKIDIRGPYSWFMAYCTDVTSQARILLCNYVLDTCLSTVQPLCSSKYSGTFLQVSHVPQPQEESFTKIARPQAFSCVSPVLMNAPVNHIKKKKTYFTKGVHAAAHRKSAESSMSISHIIHIPYQYFYSILHFKYEQTLYCRCRRLAPNALFLIDVHRWSCSHVTHKV